MPFDSNGNATVTRDRAVTGQTAAAPQVNVPFDDVQSMLSQVLLRSGVAPMAGTFNMNGFKIANLQDASNPGDAVSLSYLTSFISSINDKVSDPWWQKPIGEPFPLFWGFSGVIEPPKDKDYRYILLTANNFSSGQYNEGVLTSQSVTGSGVTTNATAIVSLSGSPINGQTVRLINTEGRFLRPSVTPGELRESQNLSHSHSVNDPGHRHNMVSDINSGAASLGRIDNQGVSAFRTFFDAISIAFTGISINANGGDEARPRSVGATYYMRIK